MIVTSPRAQRRRSRRNTGLILLLVVAITGLWSAGFYRFAQDVIPNRVADVDSQTDAIVVLTGGSGRLVVGLDLLKSGAADRLFISGVYQGIDVNQLLIMFRENPDGLASKIAVGNAVNTQENATETAAWAAAENISSIRLVTAAYHMPRSLLEFQFYMPDVLMLPHPVFPEHVKEDWWLWPGTAWLVVKEYNKCLVVWLRQKLLWLSGKPLRGTQE